MTRIPCRRRDWYRSLPWPSGAGWGLWLMGISVFPATVADQLLATGTAQHAYVGIQPATLTPQIAQQLGVSQTTGVVVLQVVPGSPAATAALQPGDVITAFNGQNTATAEEFIAKLRPVKPGHQITLTVLRAGATQQIKVTRSTAPSDPHTKGTRRVKPPRTTHQAPGTMGLRRRAPRCYQPSSSPPPQSPPPPPQLSSSPPDPPPSMPPSISPPATAPPIIIAFFQNGVR